MNSPLRMHLSPRCTARSKRTGERCRGPAVTGWSVCRFHGARGGGPKGARNGNYKHGLFTAEALKVRRATSMLVRAAREELRALSGEGD